MKQNGAVIGSALIGQWSRATAISTPVRPPHHTPTPTDSTKTIDAPQRGQSSGSNLGLNRPPARRPGEGRCRSRRAISPVRLFPPTPSRHRPPESRPRRLAWRTPRARSPRRRRRGGLPEDRVRTLVEGAIEGRSLGLIGEPRVNVLRLTWRWTRNRHDDRRAPMAATSRPERRTRRSGRTRFSLRSAGRLRAGEVFLAPRRRVGQRPTPCRRTCGG